MNRLRKFLGPILVPDLKRTRRHLAASALVIALLLVAKGWAKPRLDAWLYPPDNARLSMALAIEKTGLADITYIRDTETSLTFFMVTLAKNAAQFDRLFEAMFKETSNYLADRPESLRTINVMFMDRARQLGHYVYIYQSNAVICPRQAFDVPYLEGRGQCSARLTPYGGMPAGSSDLGWADST